MCPKISRNDFDLTERFEVSPDRSVPPVVSGTVADVRRVVVERGRGHHVQRLAGQVLVPGEELVHVVAHGEEPSALGVAAVREPAVDRAREGGVPEAVGLSRADHRILAVEARRGVAEHREERRPRERAVVEAAPHARRGARVPEVGRRRVDGDVVGAAPRRQLG